MLLPVPGGTADPPYRRTAHVRRRRELVGHARRVRARLLRQAVRRTPALDRNGIPVHEGLLLQRRDPRATRVRARRGPRPREAENGMDPVVGTPAPGRAKEVA